MDLLIVLLVILVFIIFGSQFYGAAKFHHKKLGNQKTKYTRIHAGNLRVNKTRNPYSFK